MISEDFIEDLYQYSNRRIKFLFPGIDIDYRDISHSVLVDKEFGVDNWRIIVDRLIYAEVALIKNKVRYDEGLFSNKNGIAEEIWICCKCGKGLPKSKFNLSWNLCSLCYYQKNSESLLMANKKYRINNRNKIIARRKELREENIEHHRRLERESYKRRYLKNKETILATNKKSYLKNREKRLLYLKEYYKRRKNENNNS